MPTNKPISIQPFKYSTISAPEGYKCSECGASGVKLWREYNMFLDNQSLNCADCALERAQKNASGCKYIGPVNAVGKLRVEYTTHGHSHETDQIGWLVPAVPTEDGETFWGYTSVPSDGVLWWKLLPSMKPRHTYGEAFKLMTYATSDRTERETIWNSRDGITPFSLRSRSGKEMTHIEWDKDVYAPNHKPKAGDRIFVKLSPERAKEIAISRVNLYSWEEFPVKGHTKESYIEELTKQLLNDWQGNPPDIIVVTEDWK